MDDESRSVQTQMTLLKFVTLSSDWSSTTGNTLASHYRAGEALRLIASDDLCATLCDTKVSLRGFVLINKEREHKL